MANVATTKDQNQDIALQQTLYTLNGTGILTSIQDLNSEVIQFQDELNKLKTPEIINPKNKINQWRYNVFRKTSSEQTSNTSVIFSEPIKDVETLLKLLSSENVAAGLTKSYELISVMENLLNKLMEYLDASLCQYEEISKHISAFKLLKENQTEAQQNLFLITKALVECLNQSFKRVNQLEKEQKANGEPKTKNIKSLEELALFFESGEYFEIPEKLVSELKELIKTRRAPTQMKESEYAAKLLEMEKLYSFKEAKLKETAEIYQEQLRNALADNSRIREQHISSMEFEKRIKYHEEQHTNLTLAKQRSDLTEIYLRDENLKLKLGERDLKAEISELSKKVEDLSKNPPKSLSTSISNKYQPSGNESPEYYLNIVAEIENEYGEKLTKHRDLVGKLEKENYNLRTELDNLKKEHTEKLAEIAKLEEAAKTTQPQEDSYENALAEETEMMKAAFLVKIKKLQDELSALKKKHSEDVIELRLNLQKEQETKDLLLRKLQIQGKV